VAAARVAFNEEAMAHVGCPVKGRAVQIEVRVGDAVKQGDELLIVESPELGEAQAEFIQKRTALEVAETAVGPAKAAFERASALYEESRGIALGEVQRREAEYRAADGAVRTGRSVVKAAENRLHLMGQNHQVCEALAGKGEVQPRFAVRAPLSGTVIEREVTQGELVGPEKEKLLVLADLGHLWVLADVPEGKLAEVAVGAAVRVRLAAMPERDIEGKVAMIAPSLDSATRSARVRIEVPNPDGAIRPGMFARAEIGMKQDEAAQAVLAVAEEAVQTVEGGPAVFVPVEGEADTFAKRAVTVGKPVGGMVPVLSGLKEGEKVVVNGSFILKAELGKGAGGHDHDH
jgi:cobalt-zinc-cadmium efflux system membrane fusion protein